MPGTIDDRRAASNITASLSSYLITVALGVIAAEVVIVTFVFDKRENLFWFVFFSGLGLASSTLSIYFGGRGIGQLIKRGFDGDWIFKTQGGQFNAQAILALGSLLLVAVSVFCGSPKAEKPTPTPNTQALNDGMRDLQKRVNDLESNDRAISAKVDALSTKLSERTITSDRKKKQNLTIKHYR
jgi:hypothetical protein